MLRAKVTGMVKPRSSVNFISCWAGACNDWALRGLSATNWLLSVLGCYMRARVDTGQPTHA